MHRHEDPFGEGRVDMFHFLKDKEKKDEEVLAYLRAENEYTAAVMQSEEVEKKIYDEFLSRIKQTDDTPPYRKGDYVYYTRTVEGLQYKIYCRRPLHKAEDASAEQVFLDMNELAQGHEYCSLGDLSVSHDGHLLVYAIDYDGDEQHVLRIKDLRSGEHLPETVSDVTYGLEWSSDDSTVFYVTMDEALRPHQVHRHVLGQPVEDDVVVLQEDDERFYVSLDSTMDGRFITISLDSQVTSEVHLLPADQPTGDVVCFQPRVQDVEYEIDCHGDHWYMLTNADACKNFKLLRLPMTPEYGAAPAEEILPHDRKVKLSSVVPFEKRVVVSMRKGGVPQLLVLNPVDLSQSFVKFPEPSYECFLRSNREYKSDFVRLSYSSFVTPDSVFDCDLEDVSLTLVKEKEVLGGYDRSQYAVERISATAEDGTDVPISLVRRKDAKKDGSAPLVLWGYGSYGSAYDAGFDAAHFTLVDRGVTCAIAHVRGGGDQGRYWYEDGKLMAKKNTFTDFLACARHLSEQKYTSPDRMAVYGASAGGLLIGAVVNMAGNSLFSTAVARVPFVDVVSTLLDKSLPLTVIEYEEWGNVYEQEAFEYILSYSPYDNINMDQQYPNMLIKAGLNDPRVSYWEPAKFCARLRTSPTNRSLVLLKTDMGAGHFGSSGRYDSLKQDAFEYAFIMKQLGVSF